MTATLEATRAVSIKDVYLGLYDGPHATPKPADEGPIFLGIKNLTDDGRMDLSDTRHISENEFPKWTKRVTPQPGDIVFTYEATLHRYAIIPEGFRGCLGRRLALIRPDTSKVDTRYLFYYFFSDEWRRTVAQKILHGSTVDRIPLTDFPDFEITLPPLETQRQIADILSAYDDLIENNTRRIQILEEMARTIYREWFVHFRYPGHESVPLVDSPIGPAPEGWKVVGFADLAEFVNGFAFKPAHHFDTGKPIIKIKELKNGVTDQTPRNDGSEIKEKYHITNGDILFSWSADLDAYLWTGGDALLNQHLFVVRPGESVTRDFIFHALKENMFEFRSLSQGTTMRHIKRSALAEVKLATPRLRVQHAFTDNVRPIHDLIENLTTRNESLSEIRDLLLPRFISGEADLTGTSTTIESVF